MPPSAVLYLNDGQNVFADRRSPRPKWRADEVAARLVAAGEIAPLAIVAIDHGGASRRWAEYLPYADPHNERARRHEADRYADLIVGRVLPQLTRLHPELRAADHVGIGGSSYGAIGALHVAIRHQGVFDRLLIESAPLWIGDGRLIDDAARALREVRAWIGIGTREATSRQRSDELLVLARRLARAIRHRSGRAGTTSLTIDEGARHHEDAWRARLPDALRWLFPAR